MPTLRLGERQVSTVSRAFVHPLPTTARSWESVAELAYLEAQIAAAEIGDVEREIVQLEARLLAARVWFAEREPTHPHWPTACARRAGILTTQRNREVTLHCLLLRCWTGCRDLFVALTMGMTEAEAARWTHQNALSWPHKGPQGIWQLVMEQRTPPDSWPPTDWEYVVHMRPKQAPIWDLPPMRELWQSKRRAA